MIIIAEIPGRPIPCPRPRVTRRGRYYSQPYTDWLEVAQAVLREACVKQNGGRLITGDLKVFAVFVGAHGNADLDNLIKSLLDAAQGTVFVNDRQVTCIEAEKLPVDEDYEAPMTVVNITEVE